MRIVTVIGARPQIIKAAALSRAIKNHYHNRIEEYIVHTGQHYDENMSRVFFEELMIPQPQANLKAGSGSHGKQTALMTERLETILLEQQPDALVLYGDTNSTIAGAIAASKIHIPIVHIEAGLRSFNKTMPEEINRITCDHTSTLLFSPTATGYNNLLHEGFTPRHEAPFDINHPGIFHCGDVMYDNSLYFSSIAAKQSTILQQHHLAAGNFILSTIHRDHNTDHPERLKAIFTAFLELAQKYQVVLPLHPRTRKMMQQLLPNQLIKQIEDNKRLIMLPPVSFLDMIALERNARLIVTDSGGVQKEAYFFETPCVIMRPETEWTEIVEQGTAQLADANTSRILEACHHYLNHNQLEFPPIFGDGHAAEFICSQILKLNKTP